MKLVCPLAIGGHVDHRLVRQALEAVTTLDQRLYFEDFPYTERVGAQPFPNLTTVTIELLHADIEARLTACACYRSQIPTLFHKRLDIPHIIRRRIPWLVRFASIQKDLEGATQRMSFAIRTQIQHTGGERYWTSKT
jgi:hypothetical protein